MKCKSSLFGASQRTRPTQHFKRLRRRGYHQKILSFTLIPFLQLNSHIGADIPGHAALCRLCRGACLGGWGVATWWKFFRSFTDHWNILKPSREKNLASLCDGHWDGSNWNHQPRNHGEGKHSFLGRKLPKATRLTGSKVFGGALGSVAALEGRHSLLLHVWKWNHMSMKCLSLFYSSAFQHCTHQKRWNDQENRNTTNLVGAISHFSTVSAIPSACYRVPVSSWDLNFNNFASYFQLHHKTTEMSSKSSQDCPVWYLQSLETYRNSKHPRYLYSFGWFGSTSTGTTFDPRGHRLLDQCVALRYQRPQAVVFCVVHRGTDIVFFCCVKGRTWLHFLFFLWNLQIQVVCKCCVLKGKKWVCSNRVSLSTEVNRGNLSQEVPPG